MQYSHLHLLVSILLILITACTPLRAEETLPSTTVDAGMPVPSSDSEAAPAPTEMIATEIATHTDETYSYTFDYPSNWMLDEIVLGSRAPGGYQLTSWAHEPGMVSEVPAGGTLINIFVQLWDPKADLPAFITQHKSA